MSITVSIVEDDDAVRNILARWVSEAEGFECLSDYPTVERAVQRLPNDKPDVVLMDINLSGQSGIQCVLRLHSLMPDSHFLMLTVYEDSDHIFDALAAGASGYLLKRTPRQELLDSIRQVHEGGSPMTSYIARKVVQAFQPTKSVRAELEELSPREWEVLRLLARGYSYKDLAKALGISVATVSTHIHRMYEKLHVCSRGEAVARYAQFPQPPAVATVVESK